MTRAQRIVLGLATAWPPVFAVGASGYLLMALVLATGCDDERLLRTLHVTSPVLLGLLFLTGILNVVLFVTYVRLVQKNTKLSEGSRRLWMRLLVYTGGAAAWFYFRRHVLPS